MEISNCVDVKSQYKLFFFAIFILYSFSNVHAQNTSALMFLPESTYEFLDVKKFQMKESYEKPKSYDNKEFKPDHCETKTSSLKYEFVLFNSVNASPHEVKSIEGGLVFLDKSKFKNLGLTVIKGDPFAVFNHDFNIMISDRAAQRIFGDEDPLNEILILDGKYSVMIKGVYKWKVNSLPMEFDFIAGPMTNQKINQR